MAHLFVLRSAVSFTQCKDSIYGAHEDAENNINKRKYKFNKFREGYNIPHASEWHLMEYRIKKETMSMFLRDLGGIILNPQHNDVTLTKILFTNRHNNDKYGDNQYVSVGKLFLILMWMFKKFNTWNKRLEFFSRLCQWTKNSVTFKWSKNKDLFKNNEGVFNFKPLPEIAEGKSEGFTKSWKYEYILGYVDDLDRGMGEEL